MIGASPRPTDSGHSATKIYNGKGEMQNEKKRRQNRKTARHRRNDCGHRRCSRRHGDGRFGPNDPITREQLAVFLYRYAKSRNFVVPAYATFKQPDASQIDSWALDAMKWAYSKEIIEEANGKLTPLDNAARHMIATALMQFCESYSM